MRIIINIQTCSSRAWKQHHQVLLKAILYTKSWVHERYSDKSCNFFLYISKAEHFTVINSVIIWHDRNNVTNPQQKSIGHRVCFSRDYFQPWSHTVCYYQFLMYCESLWAKCYSFYSSFLRNRERERGREQENDDIAQGFNFYTWFWTIT